MRIKALNLGTIGLFLLGLLIVGAGFMPSALLAATLTAAPAEIDFGEVALGSSAARSVTVTNNGAIDLTVTNVGVSNRLNVSEFSIQGDNATSQILTPGESRQIQIQYRPQSAAPDGAPDFKNQTGGFKAYAYLGEINGTYFARFTKANLLNSGGSGKITYSVTTASYTTTKTEFVYGGKQYNLETLIPVFPWGGSINCLATIPSGFTYLDQQGGVSAIDKPSPSLVRQEDADFFIDVSGSPDTVRVSLFGVGINGMPTVSQPVSTKLSFSAKPKIVTLGTKTLLKGKLRDVAGQGLFRKKIKIKAGKKTIRTMKTAAGGVFKLRVKPKKRTTYRAVFAGNVDYKPSSKTAIVSIK